MAVVRAIVNARDPEIHPSIGGAIFVDNAGGFIFLVGVLGGHARVAREPIRKTSCVERLPSQISPWSILKGVQRRRELSAFVDYSMHLQRIGEEGSRKKARS